MRLQVGRLVGDERVSRGVRFVEPVARELFHEIEELLRFGRRHAVPARASQKFLAHRHHVLVFLLAHGAPQDVRFTQAEPGDAGGNLDHLLLIHDHAVSFLENLLELRQVVGHPLAAQLARDEIVDHTHRPGAVKGVQSNQVSEAVGLGAPQDVRHAAAFKLEYPRRQSLSEQLIGLAIVERHTREIQPLAARRFNQLQAVIDNRQRGKPQKVHLEQADGFEVVHRVLRGDFIFAALVQRHDFLQGLG